MRPARFHRAAGSAAAAGGCGCGSGAVVAPSHPHPPIHPWREVAPIHPWHPSSHGWVELQRRPIHPWREVARWGWGSAVAVAGLERNREGEEEVEWICGQRGKRRARRRCSGGRGRRRSSAPAAGWLGESNRIVWGEEERRRGWGRRRRPGGRRRGWERGSRRRGCGGGDRRRGWGWVCGGEVKERLGLRLIMGLGLFTCFSLWFQKPSAGRRPNFRVTGRSYLP